MTSWLYCLANKEHEKNGYIVASDDKLLAATVENFVNLAQVHGLKDDSWNVEQYLVTKEGRKSGISAGVEKDDAVYICGRFGTGGSKARIVGYAKVLDKDVVSKTISLAFDGNRCRELSEKPCEVELGRTGKFSNLIPVTPEALKKLEMESVDYINSNNENECFSSDLLYQEKVNYSLKTFDSADMKDVPKPKPAMCSNKQEVYIRDPNEGKKALYRANYKCEWDQSHEFFVSATTGKNYVECHHLIPMKYQSEFAESSIDVDANIISLCPACHRKLHYAKYNEKTDMLKDLLQKRTERLVKTKVNITEEQLLSYYK